MSQSLLHLYSTIHPQLEKKSHRSRVQAGSCCSRSQARKRRHQTVTRQCAQGGPRRCVCVSLFFGGGSHRSVGRSTARRPTEASPTGPDRPWSPAQRQRAKRQLGVKHKCAPRRSSSGSLARLPRSEGRRRHVDCRLQVQLRWGTSASACLKAHKQNITHDQCIEDACEFGT